MRNGGDRHLLLEQLLGLFVEHRALVAIGHDLGVLDQGVVFLVAPHGVVVAANRVAAVQGAEPVVRVTVVAGPADQADIVLAVFGALDVLAPFIADDLDLEADLGPVRLQHLGHKLGVRVVRALYGHGPQGNLGTVLDPGGLEQLLGFFRVVGGVGNGLVVGPLGRRHGVDGFLACALVDGFEDLVLVDRHVQCLTHLQLVKRFVLHVVGDVTEVETGFFDDLQLRVGLEPGNVGRAWVKRDLALVFTQLLHARRGIDTDRENQVVEFDLARVPVVLVGGIANVGVFLVTLEHVRAGAHRLLVDVAGLAGLEQLVGILGRQDRGKAHGQVLDKGGVHRVELYDHGHRVGFLDAGDVLVQAHPGEVRELGRVGLAERMLGVEHAVEGEEHVIGVEVAGRGKPLGGVELDAITQMERPGQAVFGHVPAGCQGRDRGGATLFKFGEAVVNRLGRVVVGGGGVLRSIKTGRAAFGAKYQAVGGTGERAAGKYAGADKYR